MEGLRAAKQLFAEYPYPEALRLIAEHEAYYETIVKNPQPTGVPGQ